MINPKSHTKRQSQDSKLGNYFIANIHWIIEKAKEFQKKTSTFALLTVPKPLTVWITKNSGIF